MTKTVIERCEDGIKYTTSGTDCSEAIKQHEKCKRRIEALGKPKQIMEN